MSALITPTSSLNITMDSVRAIRHALHLGLESFGEVERVTDCYDTLANILKEPVNKDLRPIHPTGASDTVGRFAEALRALEHIADFATET